MQTVSIGSYLATRLEELGPGGLGHRAAPWRTLAITFVLLLLLLFEVKATPRTQSP